MTGTFPCPSHVDSGIRVLWALLRKQGLWGIDSVVFSLHVQLSREPCSCGYDQVVAAWWRGHKHDRECASEHYQRIEPETLLDPDNVETVAVLAKSLGRGSADGLAMACSCGLFKECEEHFKDKWHTLNCRALSPLFSYKDVAVARGRISREVSLQEWSEIMVACVKAATRGGKHEVQGKILRH